MAKVMVYCTYCSTNQVKVTANMVQACEECLADPEIRAYVERPKVNRMTRVWQASMNARKITFEASATRYEIMVVNTDNRKILVMPLSTNGSAYWVGTFDASLIWQAGEHHDLEIAIQLQRSIVISQSDSFSSVIDLANIGKVLYQTLGPGSEMLYRIDYQIVEPFMDDEGGWAAHSTPHTTYALESELEDAQVSIYEEGGSNIKITECDMG